jgi:ABC-type lipoprotein release transport system permease subunit
MPPPPGTTITWYSEPLIVPSVLAYAFLLALVTALISSVYPAHKASRLEIAEALRRAG